MPRPHRSPLFPYTTLFRSDDEESFGGAEAVPGPVPGDVTFVEEVEGGVPAPDFSADLVDGTPRSEEHTSELQSQSKLVCRLLLEKKKPIAGVHCLGRRYEG